MAPTDGPYSSLRKTQHARPAQDGRAAVGERQAAAVVGRARRAPCLAKTKAPLTPGVSGRHGMPVGEQTS